MDWYFSKVSFGVVLEDDLEISASFLDFVAHCKARYGHLEDLWMISGDQFFPQTSNHLQAQQISVSNYPLVWGWASWSEKWSEMRLSILEEKKYSFCYIYSPVKSFWWAGSKRVLGGNVDTWDIPLAFEMERKKKLTFSPPVNLVKNVGFDDAATHTSKDQFPLNLEFHTGAIDYSILEVSENPSSRKRNNKKLQKNVFRVKIKHIFSPIKYYLLESNNSKERSLVQRLLNVKS